jgi:hypothetical protein
MSDKEFLQWVYNRLVHLHKENPRLDYMLRLWAIIEATSQNQETPMIGGYYERAHSTVQKHDPTDDIE